MIPQLDDCMLEKSWKNNCGCYTLKEKMHLNVIQYVVTPSRVTILFLKSKFIFGVKILHQIIIDSGIICAPYRMPIFEFQFQKRKKPSFYFQNLAPKCLYLYWPPCWIDEVYKYLQKKKNFMMSFVVWFKNCNQSIIYKFLWPPTVISYFKTSWSYIYQK